MIKKEEKIKSPSIACTGMGAWTAYGKGVQSMWENIIKGKKVHRSSLERFPQMSFERFVAFLPQHDWEEILNDFPHTDPNIVISLAAAKEALTQAQVKRTGRWALVLGNSNGGINEHILTLKKTDLSSEQRTLLLFQSSLAHITQELAKKLGLNAHLMTISTACASSNHALLISRELLSLNLVDFILVGGTDVIHPRVIGGFHSVGAMSEAPCAPFSFPVGMSLGEGAGFMVLEREESAKKREVSPLAYLIGSGQSCDAFHATSPDPTGSGMARSIQTALEDSGYPPEKISFYDAHATGTLANDGAEASAIDNIFARDIPVAAYKSWLGHTQGPAGILEAMLSICAMQNQTFPDVGSFTRPRNISPPGLAKKTKLPLTSFVNNSAAFGGSNVSTIFSLHPSDTKREINNPVYIIGSGYIGPLGTEIDEHLPSSDTSISRANLRLRRANPRHLDRQSNILAVACQRALDHAGIEKPKRNEIVGLICATSSLPSASEERHKNIISTNPIHQISARSFSMAVRNSACGAVNRVFGFKGPDCTYVSGEGSGLHALLHSYVLLSKRNQWSKHIVAAVDEPSDTNRAHYRHLYKEKEIPQEGAVSFVLSTTPKDSSSVCIQDWKLLSYSDGTEVITNHLKKIKNGILVDTSNPPLRALPQITKQLGWMYKKNPVFGEAHSALLGLELVLKQLRETSINNGLIVCSSQSSGLILCTLSSG